MKRYTIHGVHPQGKELELKNQPYTACEDPEGLWVKWGDVENLLNNLGHDASVAGFHHRISNLESKLKCNCEEKAKTMQMGYSCEIRNNDAILINRWICPAHGYKRR